MQWHVHLHVLATEGAFSDDGTFRPLATWDAQAIMRLFRERLPARLVHRHAISQELATKLMAWRHPGFSAHVGEPISADDTQALENLAGYVTRTPLSLQRLVYLDGRWVYFSSNRAGLPADIWRIPATGGSEERVTNGGGVHPYESADGKDLFFRRTFAVADAPLFARPLGGGPERKVLECVPVTGFAVGLAGVYHVACGPDPSARLLYVLDPATGRDRLLGNLGRALGDLTVSPDGKTILFSKDVGQGADLLMIENLR